MEGGEDTASAPSTPVTPGTPAAPLFGAFRNANGRRSSSSLLRSFKCFNSEAWSLEEGGMPQATCALPPISLARKVRNSTILRWIIQTKVLSSSVTLSSWKGGSRVHRDSDTDVCGNSHTRRESKDSRSGDAHRARRLVGVGRDGGDYLHRTHLRRALESGHHHRLRCSPPFPMETCK